MNFFLDVIINILIEFIFGFEEAVSNGLCVVKVELNTKKIDECERRVGVIKLLFNK